MTAPHGPRGLHLSGVVIDEVQMVPLRTVDLSDDGAEQVVIDWPRLCGKGALTVEFTTKASPGFLRMMRHWEDEIAARRTRLLGRLADDLGKPLSLVRRQADAVDRVLEAAGIADGYGQLTPQAVRPPVPAPPRRR